MHSGIVGIYAQVVLADQFGVGDYVGISMPRLVNDQGLGLHLEIDGTKSTVRCGC